MIIPWLDPNSLAFPGEDKALTDPDGLLALGGDLSEERLVAAYRAGVFPWYEETQPILWWSPDPRWVLLPDELHISRSLKKTLRRNPYKVTFDQTFEVVITNCAKPRSGAAGTWITDEMNDAYISLHTSGVAHSVEAWCDGVLIGGLYGVAMGSVFFGESMFSHQTDASKVAFCHLLRKLKACGFTLIDCQVYTAHLESMGAKAIPRRDFVAHIEEHIVDSYQSLWR